MVLKIAPFGKSMILLGLLVAAAAWLSVHWFDVTWLGLLFAGFSAYFFRDPDRETAEDPGAMLSPADGTVMSIMKEGPSDIQTVRVFMSPLNVHVQRSPIAGKVRNVTYLKGSFAVANAPEANQNERNILRIEGEGVFAIVEQIAGFLVRRVSCYVREGEDVRQGQRIGLIYFGSQVALHVPAGWAVQVQPGQAVTGGVSVVARRS